jgi:type VI protein secretion system component Hcp
MALRNYLASISLISFLVLGLTTHALGAQAVPIFMTIDGITSEVLAWSWGASQALQVGGNAGKANIQDISLTRLTDSQSPTLLSHLAKGDPIDHVIIERGALKITLAPVLLSSYSVGGSADKTSLQTENISLNFGSVTYEFDGVSFCWDVVHDVPCPT